MDVSGFFKIMDPNAFIENVAKVGLKPATASEPTGFKFDTWQQLKAEFLIRVGYHVVDGELTVDAYAYSVPQAKLVLGKSYRSEPKNARTIAHTFANDLIKELTGQRGMFLSKIVVARTVQDKEKEIFLMDWDGGDPRQITHHHGISGSPALSFDGKLIAYSTYSYHTAEKTRNRDLWTYDLTNGKRYLTSYRRGINSGAYFTPDNKHLLLTISNSGAAEIYRATIDGKSLDRLTTSKPNEINVEPAMSPDGKKIAFSSDKSGFAMIYVMDSDGTNSKRITFAGKFNSTPDWSPDGKKITFAGFDKDHFDIFVMTADGSDLTRLTSANKPNGKPANNEYPSFSPDGRSIAFTSDRTGKSQLYIVTVDGETERRITYDTHEYQQPRWSHTFE
jgi:TolB protein